MTPLEPSQYVNAVTFSDRSQPSEGLESLTHVTSRILLDGDVVPGIVEAALSFGKSSPTIVTLTVLAEDVAPPFVASDGTHVPGSIGGFPVLATAQDEHPWEYVYLADTNTNLTSDFPLVISETAIGAVRCSFYVRRVVFE